MLDGFANLPNDYLVIELNTTGLHAHDGSPPGIVEIGMARIKGRNLHGVCKFDVRPHRPITDSARLMHGISNQDVQQSWFRPLESVWTDVKKEVDGSNIIIHNLAFDWGILHELAQMLRLPTLAPHKTYCSYQMALAFARHRELPSASLERLSRALGLPSQRIRGQRSAVGSAKQAHQVIERLRDYGMLQRLPIGLPRVATGSH